MIEYICDICDARMDENEVKGQMFTRTPLAQQTLTGEHVSLYVHLNPKIEGFKNGGHVCKQCVAGAVRDFFNEHDTAMNAISERTGT